MGTKRKKRGKQKRRGKRKAPKGYTEHHRRPRSRKAPYTNDPINKMYVPEDHHPAYHLLFLNWLPSEAVRFLNTLPQGGGVRYLYIAMTKKVAENAHRRRQKIRRELTKLKMLGDNAEPIIEELSPQKQTAFDFVFGKDAKPSEIARILTKLWIDPYWIIIAIPLGRV